MTDHVYKLMEIVGTSHDGHDAAVKAALERARHSIRNIRWFEVVANGDTSKTMVRSSIRSH